MNTFLTRYLLTMYKEKQAKNQLIQGKLWLKAIFKNYKLNHV